MQECENARLRKCRNCENARLRKCTTAEMHDCGNARMWNARMRDTRMRKCTNDRCANAEMQEGSGMSQAGVCLEPLHERRGAPVVPGDDENRVVARDGAEIGRAS